MDRVGAGLAGDAHDLVDGQVGVDRPHRLAAGRLADEVGLVGLEAVEGELVLVRVDRDRRQPQLGRRAKDADGDLGAVRDQKSLHVCQPRPVDRPEGASMSHAKSGRRGVVGANGIA